VDRTTGCRATANVPEPTYQHDQHGERVRLWGSVLRLINDHTMMDFYKAVDFVPYLIPPATDGYVYKKVYKCIHFDTKEELKMGMEENLKQYKHTKNYVQKWYAEHKNDTYDRDCGVKYWQYPVMGDIGNHESEYNATSQYYIDEGLKWLKKSISATISEQ
jgi:hypothetical protein